MSNNDSSPGTPELTHPEYDTSKGLIAWFTRNSVAANLLMLLIIVAGAWSIMFNMRATMMPDFQSFYVLVGVPFPGSTPEDVEEGVILKIEQAVEDITGIISVESSANSGIGRVRVEISTDYEVTDVMDEIKIAVDGISTFPDETERPFIKRIELEFAQVALQIQISGELDELGRRQMADEVRNELLAKPEITQVQLWGERPYEITIELSENILRKYKLTLSQVADAIRQGSVDLPGGTVRTINGDILLRTKNKAYRQFEFEKTVLISNPDGTRLTLGDIATVKDAFEEHDGFSYFNGTESISIVVMAVSEQNVLDISQAAKDYVKEKQQQLPAGIKLGYWGDLTYYLKDRLGLMFENMILGAILVFIILLLFMDLKVAVWVVVGMVITFLGTFAVLPTDGIDVTLNMVSVYGFIVVLGIVVDDAIVIGENVHSTMQRQGYTTEAVIQGAQQVATPATFGVLTTIVAFLPMIMLEGTIAAFPAAIGWVVIICLVFSLIESKLILPAHLAHMKAVQPSGSGITNTIQTGFAKIQGVCNSSLERVIYKYYQPLLKWCIEFRYLVFAFFLSLLILTIGLIAGGVVRYVMFPDVPGEYIETNLEMNQGVPKRELMAAIDKIIKSAETMQAEIKEEKGIEVDFVDNLFGYGKNSTSAQFVLELTKRKDLNIDPSEVSKRWRKHIGDIPGARTLNVSDADPMAGKPIAFVLTGNDINELSLASTELSNHIASFTGVFDIDNGAAELSDELNITIKPEAEALGLTLLDVGRQVRGAFYGEEAQRLQRGRNEVKVMVRYPEQERKSLATLDNMYIRTQQGDEVPFSSVANLSIKPGYSSIKRIDYVRAISVSANADKTRIEPSSVVEDIEHNFIPKLKNKYPGISVDRDAGSEEEVKMLTSLGIGLIFSLLGIYALLAVPLRSYLQPIIIMGVIPFGFIGAVFGHILLGLPISNMSLFGILALAGVVVNDSIILVDFINQSVKHGTPIIQAVIQGGTQRYRAIILTSLTTFFGLAPIVLEQSTQAQFIIPMAVSLSFGIVFSTIITLILIPCLYIVLNDLNTLFSKHDNEESVAVH